MNPSESTRSPPGFRLNRDPRGGWSGGNEHFRVVGNVIKIKKSDGNFTIAPTDQQRRKVYDEFGNYSQHVQLSPVDAVYQLWMTKIGPYLADWVLDKRNDATAIELPWRLLNFPAGYTLWTHLSGDNTDPANPRTDAYLYGSPHKIFRSPMEFVEHAIWLMKNGAGGPCLCKYCLPGQSQRAINSRLNRGQDVEGDNDSGSDGATTTVAALNDASRHPLFRNRLGAGANAAAAAAARARQERRAARRERSPVLIMAKDYRVGNTDTNGGGGGTAT